jgi:translation initiation factor IF-2
MSTTKAYVAGLSTTGVLIASILVLLTLGSGFVAFDGLPGAGSPKGPVERVVVDDDALGAGKKKRSQRPSKARDPGLQGAVEPYPSAPLSRAAPASVGAARGRSAAERRTRGRRASQGHGGAEAPAVGVIGGGASVGGAGAHEGRGRGRPWGGQRRARRGASSGGGPGGSGASHPRGGDRPAGGPGGSGAIPRGGGRPAGGPGGSGANHPRGGGRPAGGLPVPPSARGLLRAAPEPAGGVIWEGKGGGNGPRVVPPGLLPRPSSRPRRG